MCAHWACIISRVPTDAELSDCQSVTCEELSKDTNRHLDSLPLAAEMAVKQLTKKTRVNAASDSA